MRTKKSQIPTAFSAAVLVISLAWAGIEPARSAEESGATGLIGNVAQHLGDSVPTARYTACLLLAELPASEISLSRLERYARDGADVADHVCAQYALAILTQEEAAVQRFVAAYPEGSSVAALWRRHESAGYPVSVTPPPQRYLAELARQNNDALKKLVASLPYADAAHGESLVDLIADLYMSQKRRVEAAGEDLGVDLEMVRQTVSWRKQHDD